MIAAHVDVQQKMSTEGGTTGSNPFDSPTNSMDSSVVYVEKLD